MRAEYLAIGLNFLHYQGSSIIMVIMVQSCLCSNEAKRNQTLVVCHEYSKIVEIIIYVMTILTYQNSLKHFYPSHTLLTHYNNVAYMLS